MEVKPPGTLAELVKRRFKKVLRSTPERQFSRKELIGETEKLVGKVGKSSLAKAFAMLGKDAEVKVATDSSALKSYSLANPAAALYSRVLEEDGQIAAVSILGKSIVADAAILRLEEELKRRQESKQGNDILDEIMRKMAEAESS